MTPRSWGDKYPAFLAFQFRYHRRCSLLPFRVLSSIYFLYVPSMLTGLFMKFSLLDPTFLHLPFSLLLVSLASISTKNSYSNPCHWIIQPEHQLSIGWEVGRNWGHTYEFGSVQQPETEEYPDAGIQGTRAPHEDNGSGMLICRISTLFWRQWRRATEIYFLKREGIKLKARI